MIERIAYDDMASVLHITFRDSGKYLYLGVPASLFDELCRSDSVGSYFNERIKNHYRCVRDPERRRFGPAD